jgi:putative acetyltransferase
MIRVRGFDIGDEPALFAVFISAVHKVASADYTPEQIETWAPPDLDQEEWRERMRAIKPFIAELNDEIVGYADVQPSGYIDHFFVSGDHARRGIGRQLMISIHEAASRLNLGELTSDVSLTAQPFFARFGFEILERQNRVLDGVALPIAKMRKLITPVSRPRLAAAGARA